MMSTVRIIIAAIISIIVAVCLRKFTKIHKQYISILTVAVIFVVATVLNFIPFENTFMTFSTPEESFDYFHNKKFESQLVIDGKKSSLVIGGENGDYTIQIVPKAENGWKLARGVDTKVVVNETVDGVAINVFQYKDTQECFISVVNINGGEIEISDSKKSILFDEIRDMLQQIEPLVKDIADKNIRLIWGCGVREYDKCKKMLKDARVFNNKNIFYEFCISRKLI